MSLEGKNILVKRQLLGEILIKRGIITAQQLDQALEAQKKDPGFIGQTLVRLGYAEEIDIVVAIILQCNLPYIAADRYEIDRSIITLVSKEFVRKHHVLPLDRVGDVLSVIMLDPLDIACKAELQRMTQCRIAPFIATRREIDDAIDRWYGKD